MKRRSKSKPNAPLKTQRFLIGVKKEKKGQNVQKNAKLSMIRLELVGNIQKKRQEAVSFKFLQILLERKLKETQCERCRLKINCSDSETWNVRVHRRRTR